MITNLPIELAVNPRESEHIRELLQIMARTKNIFVPEDFKIHVFYAKDIMTWSIPDDEFYLNRLRNMIRSGRKRKQYAIIVADDMEQIDSIPDEELIRVLKENCAFVKKA